MKQVRSFALSLPADTISRQNRRREAANNRAHGSFSSILPALASISFFPAIILEHDFTPRAGSVRLVGCVLRIEPGAARIP